MSRKRFIVNGIEVTQPDYWIESKRIDVTYDGDEKHLFRVYLEEIADNEFIEWMSNNLKGYWWFFDDRIVFLTNEEDAVLCKLTWG